jgi:ABC-type uncharacterized transport system substrate-binding protein
MKHLRQGVRRATAFGLALLMVSLMTGSPAPLSAHPHVWVSALAFLGFEDGKLTKLRVQWAFDEFFSLVLYEDFDRNQNGIFEEAEIDAMREGAFTGLGEVGFFTDLRIDNARVAWDGAEDFGIAVSEDGSVVSYSFTLTLPEPVDPVQQAVTISLYDPDFYVAVDFIEDRPLRFRGNDGVACTYEFEEAADNPIYFGAVFPWRAVLSCSGKGA